MSAPTTQPRSVDLRITGMTCASCVARVEKKLNRLPGVTATVNLATETAHVVLPEDVAVADAIAAVEAAGYGASEEVEEERGPDWGHRTAVSAALSLPVAVLSMVPGLQFPYWQWLALALATPVVLWGAWPFHRAALANARHGTTTMDTLVSIGVTAAYAWSLWALLVGGAGQPGMRMPFAWRPEPGMPHIYLEVAAAVTTFILLGRYLEHRARKRSGDALRALLEVGAKDATVLRDGVEHRVPVTGLAVGDLMVVRPGEKIPTDGVVVDGESPVDTSLVTGEPVPVDVGPGDPVVGSCLNTTGRLLVRATRVGADTHLAQIARLVTSAQAGRAPVQRLADRVSAVFVPLVLALAAATLVGWLAVGAGPDRAFTAAVAVLVIACPCALGLATPTALLAGTGRGAQLGILIKGPEVLESTRRIDTVVLDKTGTLTSGRMSLVDVVPAEGVAAEELLRLAGALESASEHPVGVAIASAAADRLGALPPVRGFTSTRGSGASGEVAGRRVQVGRPEWLAEGPPEPLGGAVARAREAGGTPVLVVADDRPLGVLAVADTVKPGAAEAVAELRDLGLEPVLLTGDHERAARAVADAVGIGAVVADVHPAGKLGEVRRLQAAGGVVAMVGDGVNDAAALAGADLGIAMGTGADAAIEASDITLLRGDLSLVPDAVRLSRRTLATIKGNLFWAFAYNVAAIPLAVAGLLNPLVAGAAMAFSSVFVVSNSLRLLKFTPSRSRRQS